MSVFCKTRSLFSHVYLELLRNRRGNMHFTKWPTLLLVFLSIILTGAPVRGQGTTTLTLNRQDNGFLGTQVSLDCSYAYSASEGTRRVYFYRQNDGQQGFVKIAEMEIRNEYITNPSPVWADDQLEGRASFQMTTRILVSLIISSIECRDVGDYQCKYFVANQTNDMDVMSQTENFDVTAKPLVPQISYSPSIIKEKEAVQFTCQGNIGRPEGSLSLFLVRNGQEAPLNTIRGPVETVLDSCTFTQSATASSNFTASDNGRVFVRCKVQQQYADASHANQTQSLSVQYGPRSTYMQKSVDGASDVTIAPDSVQEVPVQSDVILKCKTDSNPGASFTWSYIPDGTNNTTTSNGAELRLTDIPLDRSGQYTCLASNVVKNITLSERFTFMLNVSNIPTSPPTTSPEQSTDSNPGTSHTPGGSTQEPDNAGLIGGVVGGLLALIIIIVIIVFLIKRKRNKQLVDEPSKPRNNQDSRTVVVHPHMVSSPGKYDNFDNYNKGYEKNEKELYYADLKFDDTPRSRKPVQILSEPTNYAEVAWPRV